MHLQQLLHSCLVWGHLLSSHRTCFQHSQETEDLMLPCWFYRPGQKILLDKFFIGLGTWQGKKSSFHSRGNLLLIFKLGTHYRCCRNCALPGEPLPKGKATAPCIWLHCISTGASLWHRSVMRKKRTRISPHTLPPRSHPHTAWDHWPSKEGFCVRTSEHGLTAG